MAWGLLFGGAFIEYVFPPFPGDTVVVAGAALSGALGWPAAPAFCAVTLGAVAGGATATFAGQRLAASGLLERMGPRQRAALDTVLEGFERYGPAYLAVNRFVPGVRALFFVAAGLRGMSWPSVLAWSTLSAVGWNTLLFTLGWVLGQRLGLLEQLIRQYSLVVGLMVGLAALWGVSALWRSAAGRGP